MNLVLAPRDDNVSASPLEGEFDLIEKCGIFQFQEGKSSAGRMETGIAQLGIEGRSVSGDRPGSYLFLGLLEFEFTSTISLFHLTSR